MVAERVFSNGTNYVKFHPEHTFFETRRRVEASACLDVWAIALDVQARAAQARRMRVLELNPADA
jgi:hypothetical protein